MAVSPDNNNQAFRVTGDYSGNGSSGYTKLRCSEGTENQYIIKDQVGNHRNNTGNHRHEGLSGFTDRAYVGLGNSKGEQAKDHDGEIFFAIGQGKPGITDRTSVI